MSDFVRSARVKTRANLPDPLVLGTKYFIEDEEKIVIDLGDGAHEYGGAAPGGQIVDTLAGNETDKGPSVRSVNEALGKKADLVGGKVPLAQLPPGGAGPSVEVIDALDSDRIDAALSAAQGKVLDAKILGLLSSDLATPADPAKIFANPTPDQWGIRHAIFWPDSGYVSDETGKTPLWALYRYNGGSWWNVLTFGIASRLTQIAVQAYQGRPGNNSIFIRQRHVDDDDMTKWQPWSEIAAPSLTSGLTSTMIWVAPNGDDATADGSEAKPFKNLQVVFDRLPRFITGDIFIKLKPGVYRSQGTYHVYNRQGGNIVIEGVGDGVKLYNPGTGGEWFFNIAYTQSRVEIKNVEIGSDEVDPAKTPKFGLRCVNAPEVILNDVVFRNIQSTTLEHSTTAIVSECSNILLLHCHFDKVTRGVFATAMSKIGLVNTQTLTPCTDWGIKASLSTVHCFNSTLAGTPNEVLEGGQIIRA